MPKIGTTKLVVLDRPIIFLPSGWVVFVVVVVVIDNVSFPCRDFK